jgi:hypothetical protein
VRKLLFWLIWLTLLAVIGVGAWWYYALPRLPEWPELEAQQTTSVHSIVVEEVKGLGKLELVKVSFQDVIIHEVTVPYLPDPKVMLKVFGETVACVDLARIDSGDVRIEGDTILLDLPAPEICYNRIDHQRSQIVDTWYTAMYAEGQRLIDRAFELGEEKMREAALKGDIYGEAEAQAQRTLQPLLKQITGKQVFLRFPARQADLLPPVEQPLGSPKRIDTSQELRPEGIRP